MTTPATLPPLLVTRDLGEVQLYVTMGFPPVRVEYDPQQNRCTFTFARSDDLLALREKFFTHSAMVGFHDCFDAARTVRGMINAARTRSLT